MKIIVACEYSGIVRDAFLSMGHDAISCDLLPSESNEFDENGKRIHLQCDIRDVDLNGYDLMIAHPPCTYLCSSGYHWNNRKQSYINENGVCESHYTPEAVARQQQTQLALDFITYLWHAPIPRICIENPVGIINTRLPFMPKPQYIQPYQFGHDASKKTGIWVRGLPPLVARAEDYIEPRLVEQNGRVYNRWANQTDSGQNALPQSATRGHDRAKTYSGIAWAMVEAWG